MLDVCMRLVCMDGLIDSDDGEVIACEPGL
jgi:hypothetical protein